MKNYEIVFNVNGKRSVTCIKAYSSTDARKILEAQYPASKIYIVNVRQI